MSTSANNNKNVFSVSKLNRLARTILESEIGLIWVSAEISNFVAASSGHWYFTLKDPRAQVRAAMFRNANMRVQQRPKEGDKVLVRANLSLYEPRGDYQLIVEHMEPDGEGQLKQQFEQLKRQLAAEGLFEQTHKQPLPQNIERVGVITSATGAALHDILTVLQRRNPAVSVLVYPTQVQGEPAARQLCQALHTANLRNEVDVLLLTRGGGSLEDLWCFNDETLARQIYASALPVVSAVGHEIDFTIADFVADVRAPTPSAAAELVSQDKNQLLHRVQQLTDRARQAMLTALKTGDYRFQVLAEKLQQNHPRARLQQQQQYLDQLQLSLTMAMRQSLADARNAQQGLGNRLQLQSPAHRVNSAQNKLQDMTDRLKQGINGTLRNAGQRLAGNSQLLESVSPLATLARGYGIGFKQDKVIKSVTQVAAGDSITLRLADGQIESTVDQIKTGKTAD